MKYDSVLNIRYQRNISRQNYIPDTIYRDMVLNSGRHTGWRIYKWLPT